MATPERPQLREETVEEWGQRALAVHGPMPEHLVQRLRRVINNDRAARSASSPADFTVSRSHRRAS